MKLLFSILACLLVLVPNYGMAQKIQLGPTNIQVKGILGQTYGGTGTSTAIPSCSGADQALIWNSGLNEFQCNTFSFISGAFSSITSGTNTTAAMIVGSSASLIYSGSGVINASELEGFSNIPISIGGTGGTTQATAFTNIVAPGGSLTGALNSTYSGTNIWSGGLNLGGILDVAGALTSTYTGINPWSGGLGLGGALSAPTATFTTLVAGNLDAVLVVGTVAYPTISSAVAAAETNGGGIIWVPCGIYTDTITITGSNITIQGQGMQCTTINPSSNSPVITFAAGGSGLGINYNTVKDLSISNISSTGDGIQFTGGNNIPNDRTTIERVAINGFASGNGIKFIGRAIWDRLIDVYIQNNFYGIYKNSAGVVNRLTVEGGTVSGNIRGGVYWVSTNPNLDIDLTFHDADIEYNGTGTAGGSGSTPYANCAGMYMNGVGVVSVEGTSYFEGNCTASTGSYNGADIRIDGTYAQQFDVTGSMLWSLTAYGIYNTAIETTGTYTGDRITFHTTAPIKIAAASDSNVTVGGNWYVGGFPQEVPDGNSNSHMNGFGPFIDNEGGAAIDGNTINPITAGVLNALTYDHIIVYNGPFVITNITGAVPGRILKITPQGSSLNKITLSTAGTGATKIYLIGGVSTETIGTNQTAVLYYSSVYGEWMEISAATPPNGNYLVMTNSISSPTPVKADTSNSNQFISTTTSDTGSGKVVGVCITATADGGACNVVRTGETNLTMGTGTCTIGEAVVVDTTTNGDVMCEEEFLAGTVIGVAVAAQSTVGQPVLTLLGIQ